MREVVLLVILSLSACTPPVGTPDPDEGSTAVPAIPKPSAAELAALQLTAEEACRCARASPDREDCWAAFNADTQRYREADIRRGSQSAATATACAPVSTRDQCFNTFEPHGGFCIVTGYHLTAGDAPPLCTAAEATAVETAFNDALKRDPDDYDRAAAEARATAIGIAEGKAPDRAAAQGGCVG